MNFPLSKSTGFYMCEPLLGVCLYILSLCSDTEIGSIEKFTVIVVTHCNSDLLNIWNNITTPNAESGFCCSSTDAYIHTYLTLSQQCFTKTAKVYIRCLYNVHHIICLQNVLWHMTIKIHSSRVITLLAGVLFALITNRIPHI